jgi:acetolactate decarboxylase
MATRRSILKAGLGVCTSGACGAALLDIASTAHADVPTRVQGPGYDLRFIGAQRETVMNGKLAAALDLRTLAKTPHLYGIGPIEELRGEVTIAAAGRRLPAWGPDGTVRVAESFEAGAPFFVWAQIPAWQTVSIPAEVRTFADLEAFVPRAAASVNLDPQRPLPFLIRGHQDLIEFHVLNRIGDAAHGMEMHRKIQVVFELAQAEDDARAVMYADR